MTKDTEKPRYSMPPSPQSFLLQLTFSRENCHSSQWYLDRTRGILKYRKLQLNIRKHLFMWRRLNTRTGCLERLWRLHPWRYSKPDGTGSRATCSGWPYLSRGIRLGDLHRFYPTSSILWFCDKIMQRKPIAAITKDKSHNHGIFPLM